MSEIKKYIKVFNSGIKTMFKEFFNKETNKKQRANMWTFSRLIISFIVPILSIIGNIIASPVVLASAFFTTGIGALTDFFDGRSARKHNSYSEFGKYLDQVVDKIFAIMLAISLSISNPLFLINLLGEGLIAGTNALYKKKYKNSNTNSTKLGKIKQWPLFISLILGFLSTLIPGISSITNVAIITTFLFQLGTIYSYVEQNKKFQRQLKLNEINKFTDEITDKEFENTKVLEKNNTGINMKTTLSKKEQLINLRNLLNNIIYLKNNNTNLYINNEIENGIQKIKK